MEAATSPEPLFALMSSLADATRLRLLRLLERNELGVVELCEIVQLPQSTVSRHLKVLSSEGWTNSRRLGTAHLYRLRIDELQPPARKLWLLAREQSDAWPAVEQDRLRLARVLAERSAESQAFFSSAAGQWDKLRGELYGESFSLHAMLALLPSDWTVVDLGCGTGQVADALAGHVKQVIGIDNNAAMLKAAAKRTASRTNVDLRRGELSALPIEAATCDAAVIVLVLTYVPDVAAVLTEARRILKPTGKLVIVDLLKHDRDDFRRQLGQATPGFSPPQLTAMLATAGFAGAVITFVPPESSARGPALFVASAIGN